MADNTTYLPPYAGRTVWKSGDVVTPQKLNNIEAGIEELKSGGSGSSARIIELTINNVDGSTTVSGVTDPGLTVLDFANTWFYLTYTDTNNEDLAAPFIVTSQDSGILIQLYNGPVIYHPETGIIEGQPGSL